jgi:hypothetical protein
MCGIHQNYTFYAISSGKVYGPFLFTEPTLAGISYWDMLENYLMLRLQQETDRDFVFQQDGATPALPSRGYFLQQSQGGCLDWA